MYALTAARDRRGDHAALPARPCETSRMRALLAGALSLLAACTLVEDDKGEQRIGGSGACFVGGCSSQLCTDRDDIASTCEWQEDYACYRSATCERQADGSCGWTQTPELRTCLETH